MPAERLLPKIIEVQFVHDAPHLEAELCVPVLAVEAVGAGDDPNAVEPQLGIQGEQEVVVARQPGEVVDQDAFELAIPSCRAECLQAWSIAQRAGLRLIGVDVGWIDRESAGGGKQLAGAHLIVDALGPLVLG
ncbi:MAG: hypothetical protein U0807_10035 [Candidatus Binatia bacterium]